MQFITTTNYLKLVAPKVISKAVCGNKTYNMEYYKLAEGILTEREALLAIQHLYDNKPASNIVLLWMANNRQCLALKSIMPGLSNASPTSVKQIQTALVKAMFIFGSEHHDNDQPMPDHIVTKYLKRVIRL